MNSDREIKFFSFIIAINIIGIFAFLFYYSFQSDEGAKNLCLKYYSQIQNFFLILAIVGILVGGAYLKTYSDRLFNIFRILIFAEFFIIPVICLARDKEKEIKEQLLSASSREEIQEILKDIPNQTIMNLKKDLENESKIIMTSDIEELLIRLKNN